MSRPPLLAPRRYYRPDLDIQICTTGKGGLAAYSMLAPHDAHDRVELAWGAIDAPDCIPSGSIRAVEGAGATFGASMVLRP